MVNQDSDFFYGSLDVVYLFPNICTNILFENTERVEALSKLEFMELLSLTTKEFYFIYL